MPKHTNKKQPAKTSARRIETPRYKSFKLSKKITHPGPKLPGALKIFKASIKQLFAYKRLFFGIMGIYLVLNIVLIKNLGVGNDIPSIKAALEEALSGAGGKLLTSVTIFGFLLSSSGSPSSDSAGVYQSILLVVISLALIWALRQVNAGNKVTIRDAFYRGQYPLIPFVLVLMVIGLQLLPLLIGASAYSAVMANGLDINMGERAVWLLILGLFALLSFYMISSSIFALYIVTLPDVRPMQALRSARELVRFRRWTIMRKLLFLPFILVVVAAVIMIPLILFVTPIAEWVFFALSMFSLAVVHGYMYNFYRELLPHESK